jgi:hypothetical protein
MSTPFPETATGIWPAGQALLPGPREVICATDLYEFAIGAAKTLLETTRSNEAISAPAFRLSMGTSCAIAPEELCFEIGGYPGEAMISMSGR